jgi:hypothetical protein
MELFEQQGSSEATQDYRLLDYNNTQNIANYDWSQDQPTQINEYSQDVNLPDGFWLGDDFWSLESSWLPHNPGRVNEAPRESASEAPHLISNTDNNDSLPDPLQVPGSAIETASPIVSPTVNAIYACERCPRTFHKMYLLRYV